MSRIQGENNADSVDPFGGDALKNSDQRIRSIVMSGVGGQGIILASDILSEGLLRLGYDVVKNEIHGMSQRGGSVFSFVRFSKVKVYSPMPLLFSADILLSFEKLEALRYLKYLKRGGIALVSDIYLPPTPVSSGLMADPFEEEDLFKRFLGVYRFLFLPLDATAQRVGNPKVANVVALGSLTVLLSEICEDFELEEEFWLDVVSRKVKKKYIDVNRKAFLEGIRLTKSILKDQTQ